jgi:hypothetical protein
LLIAVFELGFGISARELVVENDTQKRTVDLQPALAIANDA